MSTRQREWQRQQALKGLCIICAQPQERGVYCAEHYLKRQKRLIKRRQESGVAQKKCSICGEYGHNRRSCAHTEKESA